MEQTTTSRYKGSPRTFAIVRKQIVERWGEEVANTYDPYENCRTFNGWRKAGYSVKLGEKALKSRVIIEEVEKGKVIRSYPKNICLFFYLQTELRK